MIDVGCGPAGVLDLLADRVGPTGFVVGVDAQADHVAAARSFCADRGLAHVEVLEADAAGTGLPGGSFDLAHARLLLVNIAHPARVVAEMARLVPPRRGGRSARGRLHHPSLLPAAPGLGSPAGRLPSGVHRQGADMTVGRRLPALLAEAGLVEIDAEVHIAVRPPGHFRRTALVDLVTTVADQIVARRLLSRGELEEASAALRAHLEDPVTVVVSHTHQQAWGRTPASGPGPRAPSSPEAPTGAGMSPARPDRAGTGP